MQVTVVNDSTGKTVTVDFPTTPVPGDIITLNGQSSPIHSRWFTIQPNKNGNLEVVTSVLI